MNKDRIGLVIQRYGDEICGGSEVHCRAYAEHLKSIYDVDIITTTALSDTTWEKYYSAGISYKDNIRIFRFNVKRQRLWRREANISKIKNSDLEEQIATLQEIGPYSFDLFDYIRLHHSEYRILIFFTYYYYQTSVAAYGIDNAVFLPTAHDEVNIYLPYYKNLFNQAPAFIFNTEEEHLLLEKIINQKITVPYEIIGCGIDPLSKQELRELESVKLCTSAPYIVYAGRITEGKGCDELFNFFVKYKEKYCNDNLKLILIGKVQMQIPERSDIISLGFVSDKIKNAYIAKAKAFVLPSRHESLSLVLLESLSLGTPVIVTDKCSVTQKHVELSKAGKVYKDFQSFAAALDFFNNTNSLDVIKMKENGKKYVASNYSWEMVLYKINNIVRVFPKAHEKHEDMKQISPAFEQNNISVVFASDNNYVPYLSVAMHSLLSHINFNDNYDIVILSDNISEEYKSIICQDYSATNVSIRFFEVSMLLNSVSFQIHNKQLSRSTFTRLFCLDIFKNYEKILYLDCDIIVNTDISDLFKNDMKENYILAVPDNYIETVKVYQKKCFFSLAEPC